MTEKKNPHASSVEERWKAIGKRERALKRKNKDSIGLTAAWDLCYRGFLNALKENK